MVQYPPNFAGLAMPAGSGNGGHCDKGIVRMLISKTWIPVSLGITQSDNWTVWVSGGVKSFMLESLGLKYMPESRNFLRFRL
jgi:hypothetical protein